MPLSQRKSWRQPLPSSRVVANAAGVPHWVQITGMWGHYTDGVWGWIGLNAGTSELACEGLVQEGFFQGFEGG